MVKSDELDICETGIKKILSIRKGKMVKKRLKKITAINTEATHWSELIKLSQPGICEPALTEHLSDEQLQESLLHGDKLELIELPSHSQSVERAVKLTSEASGTVYGLDSRHKHIQAKVLSCQMRPSFASKGIILRNTMILEFRTFCSDVDSSIIRSQHFVLRANIAI
ncbi:hypothetical protein SNE40_019961 [Patella caerulea]|uniref:Uncharacterized protein n=1 Tax=Patella caerulea TaxID=87958 RepID=A0AAN8GJR2_PATCE